MKYLHLIVLLLLTQNSYAADIQGGIVKSSFNTIIKAQQPGIVSELIDIQKTVAEGIVLVKTSCAKQKAHYSAAQAVVNLKSKIVQSKQTLFDQGVADKSEIDIAKAELSVARAEREIKRKSINECSIKSTHPGTVVERYVTPGQYVNVGDPLLRIVDNSKLHIEFNAQASDFELYEPGVNLSVKSNSQLLSEAVVNKRSEFINDNGTFLVIANFNGSAFSDKSQTYAGMRVIISPHIGE